MKIWSPTRPRGPLAPGPRRARARAVLALLAFDAGLLACSPAPAEILVDWSVAAPSRDPAPGDFHVPPPPFSEGVFPCTDCHDPEIPVNARRRPMQTAHQEIELRHDEEHRWCLDCHDSADRDQLHLASGELVPFEESYRLCGQCHGDKYRDWRAGVHGRRTGQWNGAKEYLLCVHCHDAHRPSFQPLAPLPAPRAPRRTP